MIFFTMAFYSKGWIIRFNYKDGAGSVESNHLIKPVIKTPHGQSSKNRTYDLLLPKQARYQTSLYSELNKFPLLRGDCIL